MKKNSKVMSAVTGTLISVGTYFMAMVWTIIICALIWADSETLPGWSALIILFVPLVACLAALFAYKKSCRKKDAEIISQPTIIAPTPSAVVEPSADIRTTDFAAEQVENTETMLPEPLSQVAQDIAPIKEKSTTNTEKPQKNQNTGLLSDGRRVPFLAQLQQPIANQKKKSVESCKAILPITRTVSAFIHWYDQLITDFEDLAKLDKVHFSPPPSHELYILNEEFQLHLCDAIVRAKEEKLSIINGKYRNSKEFQEIALTDFVNDIEKNKGRFSPWNEELAKKSIEEIEQAIHPVTHTSSHSCEDEEEAPANFLLWKISYTDKMFPEAVDVIMETNQASVSVLQRRLKMGYSQAAGLIDEMEEKGIVGAFQGSQPREILVTGAQWKLLKKNAEYAPVSPAVPEFNAKSESTETENALLKARLAVALAEKENLEKSIKQDREDKMTVAKAELLTIDMMDGHDFENWCAEALKDSGFTNVSITPGSGDQGVDVVAEKDGLKYAFQCKRYNSDLGNTPVQEVFTGARFYNCHVGVVITNRNFTQGAKDAAAVTGVLLWGRSWILLYLYRKHGVMPEIDPNA